MVSVISIVWAIRMDLMILSYCMISNADFLSSYSTRYNVLLSMDAIFYILIQDGASALTWAAVGGHTSVLKLLLNAKADVDRADNVRYPPLQDSVLLVFNTTILLV
jgi:ankyrin repeat protein